MKYLQTTRKYIGLLEKKEIRHFRAYLHYKLKKKSLLLFELLSSNLELDEELILNKIKRKKLFRNLNKTCTELNTLVLDFWHDNTKSKDRLREINTLINKSSLLDKKGLRNEAIRVLEQSRKLAESYTMYSVQATINKFLFNKKRSLKPKHTFKLANVYEKNQNDLFEKLKLETQHEVTYSKVYFLLHKGLSSLTEDEIQYLQKTKEQHLDEDTLAQFSINQYTQYCDMMSYLYQSIAPTDPQQSENYILKILSKFENHTTRPSLTLTSTYQILMFNYLLFLFYENRVDDFEKEYLKLKSIQAKSTGIQLKIYASKYTLNSFQYLLNNNFNSSIKEKEESILFFDSAINQIPFLYTLNYYFNHFQIAIAEGDFETATLFSEKLNQPFFLNRDLSNVKFSIRLTQLLIHFELGNEALVINQGESIRRLFAYELKSNIAGKLFLKYLIKLSKTKDKKKQLNYYHSLLEELEIELQDIANRRLFYFTILPLWTRSKIAGANSIRLYLIEKHVAK